MNKHLRLGDRVNLSMPTKRLAKCGSVWSDRQKRGHLGIVVQFMADGDVRVWDTVENDWWCCYAKHLARLP